MLRSSWDFFYVKVASLSPLPTPHQQAKGAERTDSLSHDASRSPIASGRSPCCLSTATEGKHGDNHDTFFFKKKSAGYFRSGYIETGWLFQLPRPMM